MPRRKVTTVTEESAPTDDAEFTEILETDETEEAKLTALDGMISEFTGAADTVVNVYRQGDGKNLSFLFRTSPDELTGGEIMERCRDGYGTGDYRIHIRAGSRLVKNAPFSVERIQGPDPALGVPAAVNQGLGIAEVIAMMQSSNDKMALMFSETMRAMGEAMKGNAAPAFNPAEMQASLIQSLAALKSMTDKPDTAPADPVAMLIQGITLAKELNPKEGDTNSSDILLEGIKQFAPAIAQATQMGAARLSPPTNGAPPAGPPLDPQASADADREKEVNMRNFMLKQQLTWLIKQAESGKDPDLYAELLLDQVGETAVLEFIAKPDALDQLAAINPGVVGQRIWFERLRDAILDLTAPDPTGEGGLEGEIIPAGPIIHAIPDADNAGDVTGTPDGAGGDAPNA
jgi:hypothetical protein